MKLTKLVLILSSVLLPLITNAQTHPALNEKPSLTLSTAYKAWQTGSGFSVKVLKENFFKSEYCLQSERSFAGCFLMVQEMSRVVNGSETVFYFSNTKPDSIIGGLVSQQGSFSVYKQKPVPVISKDVNHIIGEEKRTELALRAQSIKQAFAFYNSKLSKNVGATVWPQELKIFQDIFDQTFLKIPADRQSYYAAQFYNIYLENLGDGHNFIDLQGMAKSASIPRLSGIGSEITVRNNKMYLRPLEGSGSLAAGVERDDELLAVDSVKVSITKPSDLDDLQSRVRGDEGSKVVLKVKRWKTGETLDLTVTRKALRLETVSFEIVEMNSKKFGLFKVRNFADPMTADYTMTYLIKNDSKVDGWIVDLRDNPGGSLLEAVEFLGLFLPLDTKVVGRGQEKIDSVFSTSMDPMSDKKMVVLVNHKSASASESVAGAIQELHRGVVLGTPSFGKGSVQDVSTVHPNDSTKNIWNFWPNIAYRQTASRYFFPSGKTPEWYGVQPDVELPEWPGAPAVFFAREKDLHPFSLGPLADVWTKPTPNAIPAVTDCVKKTGTSTWVWQSNPAPFVDYQVLYAGDVLNCM